ncbi:MAG: hypothetical protein J0H04_05205, partial [Hyphomicrobium denitrificans]|nr:hypothetical protein [Hyphomicrobium denitrificans]
TFAVQGPTANPQVIVNPLSLVAPGIFREVFQMTASDPKVQIRGDDRVPQDSTAARVRQTSPDEPSTSQKTKRASANSKVKSKPKKPAEAQAGSIDGWSSTTQPSQ